VLIYSQGKRKKTIEQKKEETQNKEKREDSKMKIAAIVFGATYAVFVTKAAFTKA